MAENKVVIKINYDKDKNRQAIAEPKMVTVWHTRRILAALAILALLISLPFFWLIGNDIPAENQVSQVESSETAKSADTQWVALDKAEARVDSKSVAVNIKSRGKENPVAENSLGKRPAAIIFDRKVVRASLNKTLKDSEPDEPAVLPVKIAEHHSVELFYFNEIKNMKDKALFHRWLKDGKLVQNKALAIKDSKARVASARVFAAKDKGEWQIQLVDAKGKVYSEVNFSVSQE